MRRHLLRLGVSGSPPCNATAVTDALAVACEESGVGPGDKVTVELDIPPVQRRLLRRLPPGRLKHVRDLVRHQATRFFQLPPSGVVIDVVRHAEGHLAVGAPSDVVDSVLGFLRGHGVVVLDVVPPLAKTARGLSLLPLDEHARRERRSWRRLGVFGVVTLGFGLTLGAFVAVRVHGSATAAAMEVKMLQEPSAKIQAVRRQLDSLNGVFRAVTDSRRAGDAILRRLSSLSRALPDSAVLTSISLRRDGALEASGVALEPLAVLAAVRRIPGLDSTKIEIGVATDYQGRSWARFDLVSQGRLP